MFVKSTPDAQSVPSTNVCVGFAVKVVLDIDPDQLHGVVTVPSSSVNLTVSDRVSSMQLE